MTVWRAGKTQEVELKMRVLGAYGATAPFGCAKRSPVEATCMHLIAAACETLGFMKSPDALPVLIRQLSHADRGVRFRAAAAI